MFWGSFSYYEKGPCYIWEPEIVAEKKASKKDLEERNAKVKAEYRRVWDEKVKEAKEYFEKYKRNKGGLKPKWVYNKKNRAIIWERGRGGID